MIHACALLQAGTELYSTGSFILFPTWFLVPCAHLKGYEISQSGLLGTELVPDIFAEERNLSEELSNLIILNLGLNVLVDIEITYPAVVDNTNLGN